MFKEVFKALGYEVSPGVNLKRKQKRILLWTGKESKKEVYTALNVFNSPENKHGEYIKMIVGTSTIKEGISFKDIKDVHIVSPWWNHSRIEQVIARAIRFKSHDKGAIVNVYKHISLLSDNLRP